MKKGLILLLAGVLVLLLIPSALAWNHARGFFSPSLMESITPEQEEDLASLLAQQKLAMMRSQGRLQELREELMMLRSDFYSDPDLVEERLQEMAALRADLFRVQQQNFQELKEILTEEQLADYMARMERSEEDEAHWGRKGNLPHRGRRF